jgi:hypothetical protein
MHVRVRRTASGLVPVEPADLLMTPRISRCGGPVPAAFGDERGVAVQPHCAGRVVVPGS